MIKPKECVEMEAVFESFEKDVLEASLEIPVLADFWAEWCGPCRVLGPVLERLEKASGGAWRLVKVNVDEHPDVAQAFQIQGIPAVKLFFGGREVAEFVGALPEAAVRQWLDENLPSETREALQAAVAELEAGNAAQARSILEAVLEAEPGNLDARIYLAQVLLEEDPARAVELVKEVDEGHSLYDLAQAVRTLARLLSGGVDAGDGSEAWARYMEGCAALGERRYADALEAWIAVLEKGRRDVDNDGARRVCVALFHLLGERHEVTRKYRRAFSSALY